MCWLDVMDLIRTEMKWLLVRGCVCIDATPDDRHAYCINIICRDISYSVASIELGQFCVWSFVG